MDNEIVNILRDVIKEELKPINDKLSSLENKLDNLENKVDGIDNKVDGLQVQVKENTTILNALEYSAEINKSDHESK